MLYSSKLHLVGTLLFLFIFSGYEAHALPAFAMKENVPCMVCHTNGSAPHLTKAGYEYRRAGFRFPNNIGNVEKDNQSPNLTHHMAAGVTVDYEYGVNRPIGGVETQADNEINVREVEIWPLIGSFLGNYAAWSELDMSPNVASQSSSPSSIYRGAAGTGSGSTLAASGGVNLAQADLRYNWGNPELYFGIRAGLLAPEGIGASDQWLDDGAIPLMDTQTAQYNGIDTLVTPLGAMQSPQMGFEMSGNYGDTHLTLGTYNGFDGTNGLQNGVQSTATPVLMSPEGHGRDYKIQLDQFIGGLFEVTGVYYSGKVSLLDPSNTVVWQNSYNLGRLYLSCFLLPNKLDLFAGYALGNFQYVNSGSTAIVGTFNNRGGFIGANYYLMDHVTLSTHIDQVQYSYGVSTYPRTFQYTLMAGFPFENSIFNFHFVKTDSEVAGLSSDFRAEWRFFF